MAAGNGLTSVKDTEITKQLIATAAGKFSDNSAAGANWIGLSSTQVTTTKVAANFTEWTSGSDGSYARIAMGAAGAGWSLAAFVTGTGVVMSNTSQLAFAAVTSNAQTLFSVGFFDALTSGILDWFADLGSSQAVAIGIIVQFNASTDINLTVL
jgi:hypothetical protein